MRKLFYFLFCTVGMIGFWYFIQFMVTGVSGQFGDGFACGIGLIVIILWVGERLGVFRIVEPEKGIWIPNDHTQPSFGEQRDV